MMTLVAIFLLCGLLSLAAYLGTGNDERNLRSFGSYPEKVQKRIRENPAYKGRFREPSPASTFIGNIIVFTPIIFLLGLMVRTDSWIQNFLNLFLIGQAGNIFDLLVIDMLWWRNSIRVRIGGTEDMEREYRDMTPHLHSFYRALVMFTLIAAVDTVLFSMF